MQKADVNPMHKAHAAPRCTAKSKRTGPPCRAPAVTGWSVCRVHGAGGGHAAGASHPRWQHGGRSQEAVAVRRMVSELTREARDLEAQITASWRRE